jgi:hypothetical protein
MPSYPTQPTSIKSIPNPFHTQTYDILPQKKYARNHTLNANFRRRDQENKTNNIQSQAALQSMHYYPSIPFPNHAMPITPFSTSPNISVFPNVLSDLDYV